MGIFVLPVGEIFLTSHVCGYGLLEDVSLDHRQLNK
jgi:hypothetical protein